MKKLSQIGQIKVTLQRCREASELRTKDWTSNFDGVNGQAVPEKALKGRSISSHTK